MPWDNSIFLKKMSNMRMSLNSTCLSFPLCREQILIKSITLETVYRSFPLRSRASGQFSVQAVLIRRRSWPQTQNLKRPLQQNHKFKMLIRTSTNAQSVARPMTWQRGGLYHSDVDTQFALHVSKACMCVEKFNVLLTKKNSNIKVSAKSDKITL